MTFLLASVGLVIGSVPVLGGDLRRLGGLRLRGLWLVPLGIAVQVAVLGPWAHDLPSSWAAGFHLVSYAPAAAVVVANRRLPGAGLIAVGGAANLAAIVANGGVMPAGTWATRVAGRALASTSFRNSTPLPHPRLLPLGDVLAWPAPLPGATAFSIGDVLLVAGLAVLLHRWCRPPLPAPPTAAATPA